MEDNKPHSGSEEPIEDRKRDAFCVEAENFLRAVLDNSNSAFLVVNKECRLVRVNPAFERLVGMSSAQLVGLSAYDMYSEEDATKMDTVIRRIFETALPITFEATFTVRGTKRTFINAHFPILDEDGAVTFVGCTITEITEHKRYESELRVAHRALVVLGECNRAVIFSKSEYELTRSICRTLVEQGGYSLAWVGQVKENVPDDVSIMASYGFDADDTSSLEDILRSTLQEMEAPWNVVGNQGPTVFRMKYPFSTTASDSMHDYPVCMGSALTMPLALEEAPPCVLGICAPEPDAFDAIEIEWLGKIAAALSHGIRTLRGEGERERAQAALLESEARYRAVVEDQTDIIARFRPDGTFTFVNDVFCRLFGVTREEILGKTWHPLCHEDDRERTRTELAALSQDNPTTDIENRVIDGNGEVHWMEFASRGFYDEDGKLVEIQTVGRDVTKQKQLQEEAMRAAKFASLGELAAGLAHEINNPINGIINCAQLLSDEAVNEGRNDYYLRLVIREGRHIAEIVRSLLTMARQDTDVKTSLRPEDPMFLALDLLRAQMEKHGVNISFESTDDLPTVFANRGQLQQVFLNLLSNAFHALNQRFPKQEKGKQLELSMTLQSHKGIPHVVWQFRDYGTGIEKADLPRLFDPFFTTKAVGEGTGLGLSISRSIISQHGGYITLENAPGGGTLATVALPAIIGVNNEHCFCSPARDGG